MTIKTPHKPRIKLSMILLIGFLVVVIWQIYMAYAFLMPSFTSTEVVVLEGSVVRVDLKAYQEAVDYLSQLYDYALPSRALPRDNPFVSQ